MPSTSDVVPAVVRVGLCAVGALLPLMVKITGQDQAVLIPYLVDGVGEDGRYMLWGYLVMTPIFALIGGVIGYAVLETNRLKLLALGVSAPALVTTWAGQSAYAPASEVIDPPYIELPTPEPGPTGLLPLFAGVAHAQAPAADAPLRRVADEESGLVKGIKRFFNVVDRYWLVIGSFEEHAAARDFAERMRAFEPTRQAFVGLQSGSGHWPVIAGPAEPIGEARLRLDAVRAIPEIERARPFLSKL